MEKIKVLHVILDIGPGGAERVVLNYIGNCDITKFESQICILYRLFENEKREMDKAGIRYVHLNKKRGWDSKALFSLVDLIKNEKIDILHLHNISAVLYGTLARIISSHRLIFRTEHNIITSNLSPVSRAKKWAKIFFGMWHKRIICVSDEVKRSHLAYNSLFEKKYVTIHNGIDPVPFDIQIEPDVFNREFGFTADNIIIGKIASMYPQKAHEVFFEAAKLVLNKFPNARFLIVGDGPRRGELEHIVLEMGLEKEVIFTGLRKDIPALLKFMDIFALSSSWEGFPMTILEAMASETPVVVTDVGGNREAVIDGKTGFLVNKANPGVLADAIVRLAGNQELMSAMGKAGRERVINNFTSEIMVRKTEKLYLEELNRK